MSEEEYAEHVENEERGWSSFYTKAVRALGMTHGKT
jgi:hypothetical protein